ncbi:MAG: hypothetical protein JJ863_01565 [Deltaproteobacteria bacterium]|nr:hypothetical protein [Deltaproteobacteria bacterium]
MGMLSNWIGRKVAPVDVEKTKSRVREAEGEGLDASGVAERLTEKHARRSAVRGFLTGIPGGIWTLPLMVLDVRGVWSERASLAAGLHYVDDPTFFDSPDWWKDVWRATSALPQGSGAKGIVRFAVQEAVIRRLGRAVVTRTGTRFVPVLGGVVGAAWNYTWVKREGSRMRIDILGPLPDEKT